MIGFLVLVQQSLQYPRGIDSGLACTFGTRFAAVIFTNLTRDHLDFHGDMPRYWETKKRLFTELLPALESGQVDVVISSVTITP